MYYINYKFSLDEEKLYKAIINDDGTINIKFIENDDKIYINKIKTNKIKTNETKDSNK